MVTVPMTSAVSRQHCQAFATICAQSEAGSGTWWQLACDVCAGFSMVQHAVDGDSEGNTGRKGTGKSAVDSSSRSHQCHTYLVTCPFHRRAQ